MIILAATSNDAARPLDADAIALVGELRAVTEGLLAADRLARNGFDDLEYVISTAGPLLVEIVDHALERLDRHLKGEAAAAPHRR